MIYSPFILFKVNFDAQRFRLDKLVTIILIYGSKKVKFLVTVLYMSFDRFLLAVESRDLSQADTSIIRVSSFPKAE